MKQRTLQQLREQIAEEEARNGPYSHNVISLCLMQIERRFGMAAALKSMPRGWKKTR